MAGYNYTKRSVCYLHGWLQLHLKKCLLSSWLVAITLKEVSTLCMTGYNYTKRSVHSAWLVTITLKEVSTLCMTGYNYTKRSVDSLRGWLQLH